MSNQAPSKINTFAYILLSDVQTLQSQKKSFHIENKVKRFIFTVKLTVKQRQQQQITVIHMSVSAACIQYNERTTHPFVGNQGQVEWDWGLFMSEVFR